MTSRDFCYWLQGYFEINEVPRAEPFDTAALSKEQVACIKKHLALVFVHEIDPSAGPPEHQKKLDEIHNSPFKEKSDKQVTPEDVKKIVNQALSHYDPNPKYRC